ncbi:MAG TPA: STM3941 family protein, partial [Chryseosolibacter sp.]|nr:STM3941 family protein [Chryseosolibacter sp.]
MMDQERIEIKVSKKKAVFALLGSVAFVVVCAWLIGTADDQTRYNPAVMRTVAYIGIAFFGIAGLYVFYKLFDSKPGLIIDSEGIFDNS